MAQSFDCFQHRRDECSFRSSLGQEQLPASGAGDDFPGGGEEPVAPAFDVPCFGRMPVGQCGELQPGDEVAGQGGDVGQGLVRGEVVEGQFAQAGVFRVLIRFSRLPRASPKLGGQCPCRSGAALPAPGSTIPPLGDPCGSSRTTPRATSSGPPTLVSSDETRLVVVLNQTVTLGPAGRKVVLDQAVIGVLNEAATLSAARWSARQRREG